MNASADAGETLRSIFDCIHTNAGTGFALEPVCQQKLKLKVKCSKCGSETTQKMDNGLFTQVVYMQEWLDLAQKELKKDKLSTNINGQFFPLMKLLNEKKTDHRCPSPTNACSQTNAQKLLHVHYVIEAPFPSLLIYELSWPSSEIKALNTFQVLASLPPYFFLPSAYTLRKRTNGDQGELRYLYKLQSMVCWTGRHYLTFMRVTLGPR